MAKMLVEHRLGTRWPPVPPPSGRPGATRVSIVLRFYSSYLVGDCYAYACICIYIYIHIYIYMYIYVYM